jgi:hypothetical protein
MHRFMRSLIGRVVVVASLAALLVPALAGPSDAIIYEGKPNLALTAAMVVAGGGPEHFSSFKLYKYLTGSLAGPEATKLTNQFGASEVKNTFAVFDYAVDDVVHIVTVNHIALPPPSPSASTPKSLAIALYEAGETPGNKWDVGYFLEHLITHPIHHAIMHDMDAKFGQENNANFHMVLDQMMHDLGVAYGPALH